jgi:uncharacterized ferritin-like protein (DUF455 family)
MFVVTFVSTSRFCVLEIYQPTSIQECAQIVLSCHDLDEKIRLTKSFVSAWESKHIQLIRPKHNHINEFPMTPARPTNSPSKIKSKFLHLLKLAEGNKKTARRHAIQSHLNGTVESSFSQSLPSPKAFSLSAFGLNKNSIELTIHGIAHAESWAMDLFWDTIGRYVSNINFESEAKTMPIEFYDDMVHIVGQEADHCAAWMARLNQYGCPYGSLPTYDGLLEAANKTQGGP